MVLLTRLEEGKHRRLVVDLRRNGRRFAREVIHSRVVFEIGADRAPPQARQCNIVVSSDPDPGIAYAGLAGGADQPTSASASEILHAAGAARLWTRAVSSAINALLERTPCNDSRQSATILRSSVAVAQMAR